MFNYFYINLNIINILSIICNYLWVLFIFLSVAFFTLAERKVLSSIQRRKGPNIVGFGYLQPIADGAKLLLKENIFPINANIIIFLVAPLFTLSISLIIWCLIPLSATPLLDINIGLLFILALSSLGIYGIIIAGWSSNSKYAFLGGLRSAAQILSYELPLGLTLIAVVILSGSLNINIIVYSQQWVWYIFPLCPFFLIYSICGLAETNRPPFDLPEAEGELVAGYFVEYASMIFAMFFLAEYSNMLIISALTVLFFFGGWLIIPLFIKLMVFVIFFIWTRATYPRYRYDQLMNFGWKVLIPITLSFFSFYIGIMFSFNILPPPGGFIFILLINFNV